MDLEKRQVVDLLSDREKETLAHWLARHPEIEIISRDRASTYREGAKMDAPLAIQGSTVLSEIRNEPLQINSNTTTSLVMLEASSEKSRLWVFPVHSVLRDKTLAG